MSQQLVGNGAPLIRGGRWLLAAWSLFLLTGFALAILVSPDPRGFGTHQQFGLPPCTLRLLAGVPCPSCGATTSFAHFVRGEWPSAIRANGAAFVLACVCLVQIPWSWVSIAKGRLWSITKPERTLIITLLTLSSLFILQWAAWLVFGGK